MTVESARRITAAAFATCMIAGPAAAQQWPTKTVRILVPFAAGGGVDSVTRIMAQKMSEQLGNPVVVENRIGGAGVLAAELTSKAPPDGYTFFTSAPEFAINPAIRSKPPYDPFRDFTCISMIASGVFMLAGHPSVPVRNVKQLIALAKAKPGQLNYGSSGTGGINHLSGELFQSMAGIKWVHVPFKGGAPSVAGLMGGEVDFVFASAAAMVGASRAGKIRPIGVTGSKRFSELPDVPTISESGLPGYDVLGWYGMYGPPGMAPDLVKRVHGAASNAMNSPDVKDKLTKTGTDAVMSTPEEFATFMRTEVAKWTKVVKAAKLTID